MTPSLSEESADFLQNTSLSSSRISGNAQTLDPCAMSFYPSILSNLGDENYDPLNELRQLKGKNADRPVIAHLNINSIAPKFDGLQSLVKDNLDLLLVSETKVDDSYPSAQFKIENYSKPIRLDRTRHGGGLMFFARDDLPCHEIKCELPADVECIFLELKIRQCKWLVVGGYNPHRENISYFLKHMGMGMDKLLCKYENLLLLGDWNCSVNEKEMKEFCDTYNLENLIKGPTCFKSVNNPSSIDIMLTNKKLSFQNSLVVETGLSDFHRMTISVLKRYFKKKDPITITYRDLRSFDAIKFREEIKNKLEKFKNLDINDFQNIFKSTWESHAPLKKKVVRGNNAPFMNRTLSKAFMHISRLKNRYHKFLTEGNRNSFKRYRNFCVSLLKKEKRNYYNNLDIKTFQDNKKFWQRVKPLFSEKN